MEENKNLQEEVVPTVEETQAAEVVAVEETVVEEVVAEAAPVVEVIEEAPAKVVAAPASIAPEADFDWDAYEKGDILTAQEKENLKNVYDNTLNAIKDKEVVEGTVISINKREVVVILEYIIISN